MMDPFRAKLVNIVLVSVFASVWGLIHLYPLTITSTYQRMPVLDITLWLIIGTLMWFDNHIRCLKSKKYPTYFIIGFILSWGLMILLIFLPAWLPLLKQNKFGIEFNFQNSPVVLIAIINFLLGYCIQATMKILPVGWHQTQVSFRNCLAVLKKILLSIVLFHIGEKR